MVLLASSIVFIFAPSSPAYMIFVPNCDGRMVTAIAIPYDNVSKYCIVYIVMIFKAVLQMLYLPNLIQLACPMVTVDDTFLNAFASLIPL